MKRLVSVAVLIFLIPFLLIACGQRVTEEQLYAKAKGLEAKENFSEAVKAYQELIHKYPKGKYTDEAEYKLGLLYANNLKDFPKAVETYQTLVTKYPASKYAAQAYFMIGYHYANDMKDLEKAREAYKNFLEKFPEHELAASVKWELENLGKDISELDIFGQTETAKGGTAKSETIKKESSEETKAKTK